MQEIYDLFSPIIFQIGPLKFYWYGLFYAISFYFGYVFILKNLRKTTFPKGKNNIGIISEHEFDKMFFGIAIFALIGGRLGHVLFYDFAYFSQNLLEIFQVWKGGMASHGGIIGAIIGLFLFKNKKINIKKLLDLFAISGAFGFGLGRLGNFINGELFGKIFEKIDSENFFSFLNFICVDFGDGVCRHPVQIYSSLTNFLIFGILFFLLQKKFFQQKKNFGKIFYLFLIFFGIQRFFLEFIKEDFVGNNYFEILTTGQIFSVLMVFVGSFLFWNKKFFCNK